MNNIWDNECKYALAVFLKYNLSYALIQILNTNPTETFVSFSDFLSENRSGNNREEEKWRDSSDFETTLLPNPFPSLKSQSLCNGGFSFLLSGPRFE